ncbi:hypothetical protein [Minwuia sp.]|uniref:hypothetical protein n=1 Tax=Minwuia sp. TaxID=2493630 RepID=UPI003A9535CE
MVVRSFSLSGGGAAFQRLCIAAASALWIAVLLLMNADGARAAATCTGAPETDVRIRLQIPDVDLIHEKSSGEITQIAGQSKKRFLENDTRLNGFAEFRMQTGHQVSVRQLRPGGPCYYLEDLDIWITVQELRIHIASELPPGSCLYRVTLAHERKHIDIYRESVGQLRDEFRAAIHDGTVLRPISAGDVNAALRRYSTAVGTLLSDLRNRNAQRMTRRNAVLDTPAAYRAEYAQCP